MRRVMIVGSCGSGKSTLARNIGKARGLPVFHLDRLYHRPGWVAPDKQEFAAVVARVAALPEWVIDGNYLSTAGMRLSAADTLIQLDVSRTLAMTRVVRRMILRYGRQRPDSADGCPERFDPAFLRYVWNWERDIGPRVRSLRDGFTGRIVLLRSPRAARDFVSSL